MSAKLLNYLSTKSGKLHRFAHAMVRQTLLEELPLTRRVRMHARIGEVLEQMYGQQAKRHAAELAFHFNLAETVTGSEKLAHFALLAGEEALEKFAYEEAMGYFQRGLEAKEGRATDAETAALLFGYSRARRIFDLRTGGGRKLSSDEEVILGTSRRAFDYYLEHRDIAGLVAVATFGPFIAPPQ